MAVGDRVAEVVSLVSAMIEMEEEVHLKINTNIDKVRVVSRVK